LTIGADDRRIALLRLRAGRGDTRAVPVICVERRSRDRLRLADMARQVRMSAFGGKADNGRLAEEVVRWFSNLTTTEWLLLLVALAGSAIALLLLLLLGH